MQITVPNSATKFQLAIADAGIAGDYALNLLAAGAANADFAADCADQAFRSLQIALELPAYDSAHEMARRAGEAFSAARTELRSSNVDVAGAVRLLNDGMNQAQYASDIAD